jgi:chloramphenicol 3-O-phosphotransferase
MQKQNDFDRVAFRVGKRMAVDQQFKQTVKQAMLPGESVADCVKRLVVCAQNIPGQQLSLEEIERRFGEIESRLAELREREG